MRLLIGGDARFPSKRVRQTREQPRTSPQTATPASGPELLEPRLAMSLTHPEVVTTVNLDSGWRSYTDVEMSADGNYIFLADYDKGLRRVSVGMSGETTLVSTGGVDYGNPTLGFLPSGHARSLAVSPDSRLVYLANDEGGLQIVRHIDENGLISVGGGYRIAGVETRGNALDVALSPDGRYAFVAEGNAGLEIIDVSTPTAPRVVGSYASFHALCVAVSSDGQYAFVNGNNLPNLTQQIVLNVSQPSFPWVAGYFDAAIAQRMTRSTDGRHLYVGTSVPSLQIVDVTNPFWPALIGETLPLGGGANLLGICPSSDGNHAFVAVASGIRVVDVRDPMAPIVVGALDTTATFATAAGNDARFLYAGTADGLAVINLSFTLKDVPNTGLRVGEVLRTLGTGLSAKFNRLAVQQAGIERTYAKWQVSWPAATQELRSTANAFAGFYKAIAPVVSGKRSSVSIGAGIKFTTADIADTERVLCYLFRDAESSASYIRAASNEQSVKGIKSDIFSVVLGQKKGGQVLEGWMKEVTRKITEFFQPVVDTFNAAKKIVTGLFSGATTAAVTEQRRVDIANTPGPKQDALESLAAARNELIVEQQQRFDTLTAGVTGKGAEAVSRLEELAAKGGSMDNILMSDIVRLDAVSRNRACTGSWAGELSRDGLTGDVRIRFSLSENGTLVKGTINHTFYANGQRSRTMGRFEGVVEADGFLYGSAVVRNSSGSGMFSIKWGPMFNMIVGDDYVSPGAFGGTLYEEDTIIFSVRRN